MKHAHVVVAYKNSKTSVAIGDKGPYSVGGLAANAAHTVEVLHHLDVHAKLLQVEGFAQLHSYVRNSPHTTHVVIEAIWLSTDQVKELAVEFPKVKFIVRSHSKIGFLQVEPEAVSTIRHIIELRKTHHNVYFSSNNKEFAESMTEAYGLCLYLPNLYDTLNTHCERPVPPAHTHVLNIASFGATRLLKLHPAAALAAIQISKRMGKRLVFYINTDKTPGGDSVRRTIRNMFEGLDDATLVEVGWQDTKTFQHTIAQMDLVIQLSATETFCMVAADAITQGVPVIGGPAVAWLPKEYQVEIDSTMSVASAGVHALKRRNKVVRDERRELEEYIQKAAELWLHFLR